MSQERAQQSSNSKPFPWRFVLVLLALGLVLAIWIYFLVHTQLQRLYAQIDEAKVELAALRQLDDVKRADLAKRLDGWRALATRDSARVDEAQKVVEKLLVELRALKANVAKSKLSEEEHKQLIAGVIAALPVPAGDQVAQNTPKGGGEIDAAAKDDKKEEKPDADKGGGDKNNDQKSVDPGRRGGQGGGEGGSGGGVNPVVATAVAASLLALGIPPAVLAALGAALGIDLGLTTEDGKALVRVVQDMSTGGKLDPSLVLKKAEELAKKVGDKKDAVALFLLSKVLDSEAAKDERLRKTWEQLKPEVEERTKELGPEVQLAARAVQELQGLVKSGKGWQKAARDFVTRNRGQVEQARLKTLVVSVLRQLGIPKDEAERALEDKSGKGG